jgi:rhodanese-related sulfurtransferase
MSQVPLPQSLSVHEISNLLASAQGCCMVDVRQPWERELCRIEGSFHIPLDALSYRLDELPRDVPLITFCHHGVRSLQAAVLLKNAGFSPVVSMGGGIDAWAKEIDTSVGIY